MKLFYCRVIYRMRETTDQHLKYQPIKLENEKRINLFIYACFKHHIIHCL